MGYMRLLREVGFAEKILLSRLAGVHHTNR